MTHSDFVYTIIGTLDDSNKILLALAYIKETKGIESPEYYQLDVLSDFLRTADAPANFPAPDGLSFFYANGMPLGAVLGSMALVILSGEDYDKIGLAEYIVANVPDHADYKYGHSYGY